MMLKRQVEAERKKVHESLSFYRDKWIEGKITRKKYTEIMLELELVITAFTKVIDTKRDVQRKPKLAVIEKHQSRLVG